MARQEIEVKLRVADAAAMRRTLERLGGRVVRRVHERNELFDTPRGTLRKRGELMRLREETPQSGRRQTRFVLTFKGPSLRDRELRRTRHGITRYGRYKVRLEEEFFLPDGRGFRAVAAQSGMRPSFRYEKVRTSYRIPGARGVHLELDDTPCGMYMELEGPRRAIDRLARRLGYLPADYITRSYAALHFEDCRRRGVRAGDMMFRSRKK